MLAQAGGDEGTCDTVFTGVTGFLKKTVCRTYIEFAFARAGEFDYRGTMNHVNHVYGLRRGAR
jgi:hypothetical protein